MRAIGWLCIMGACVSLLAGLVAGQFVRRGRRHRRRGESEFEAFLRDEFPGLIPFATIAAALVAVGLVLLRIATRR